MRRLVVLIVALAATLGALPAAAAVASPWSDAVSGASGLAAWWRLGETSGTTAAAAVGAPAGTWSGTVTLGAVGAVTDDADGSATLGSGAALALGTSFNPTSDFSFEAWVKPQTSYVTRYVLSKGNTTAGFALELTWYGAPIFHVGTTGGAADLTGPAGLTMGVWHYVAGTVSGHTMTLYVDGQAVGTKTAPGTPKGTTSTLYAGRNSASASGYYSGGLDEIALYNGALSAAQVAAHAAAGIDAAPVHTTISGGPASPTADQTAAFTLSANKDHVTFACSLDSAAFSACPANLAYANLGFTTHTLRVRATDRWGQVEATPASVTWTLDEHLAPDYSAVPPRAAIASSVPALSNSTGATFTLSADRAPATLTCSVDGRAYAACGTTLTLKGLVAGAHSLRVLATDRFGQVSIAPATFSWTVDVTAPDTWALAVVRESDGLVAFASEPNAAFQCKTTADWQPCGTPVALSVTAPVTLAVRAIDGAGNVDASPATVSLAPGQAAVDTDGAVPFTTASTAVAFSASRGATFTCSVDGGGWGGCASPLRLDGLAWGDHALAVRAAFPGTAPQIESPPLRWTAVAPAPRIAAMQFPVIVQRAGKGRVRAAGRPPALRFALNVAVPVRVTVSRVRGRKARTVGAWTMSGVVGDNRALLPSKLGRRMSRGRYRVTAQPQGAPVAAKASFAVV